MEKTCFGMPVIFQILIGRFWFKNEENKTITITKKTLHSDAKQVLKGTSRCESRCAMVSEDEATPYIVN